MRRALLLCLWSGCGRLGFDATGLDGTDGPSTDGTPTDGMPTDGMPTDGPMARACHTDPRYVASGGLANTYREGVPTVTWAAARIDCMADDADLWVVESALEANAFTGDWTGITDVLVENEWRKLDGTLATFLVFQTGEPDGGTGENCLRNDSMGFEDRDCADQRDYVCECPAP